MFLSKKEKNLLKNTGIIALGTMCSKALVFFLLPLYTSYLSTEDYGVVDVLQTISYLLIPFISFELGSSVFRYMIDEGNDGKKYIISSSFFVQFINIIIFLLIVLVLGNFIIITYKISFIIYTVSMLLFLYFQNVIRGFGNNKLYSLVSFLNTTLFLLLNILFIVIMGYNGCSILIGSSIANIFSIVFIGFRLKLWNYINIKYISKEKLKELLKYSMPLIPNTISWWVANISDRLLINYFLGIGLNGIYAVANKIPTIYTTVFNAFNIAWTESASKEILNNDSSEFINESYNKSIKLFACICLGIISIMPLIFSLIIKENYYDSYYQICILMIAIFFNSLCSIYGGILTALKKSSIIGSTTIIGAIVNFIINIIFIKYIGLYAASISTLISYIAIWIYRRYEVNKSIKIEVSGKLIVNLLVNFIIVIINYYLHKIVINALIFLYIVFYSYYLNKDFIFGILGFLHKKNNN